MAIPVYPSDLTNAECEVLAPLIPYAKPGGRPRSADMRRIVNGIFYVLRSGCAWRYLPREYGAWPTVYYYFRRFRLDGTWAQIHAHLRELARLHAGRDPTPSAAVLDSQSVETLMGGLSGYDGNKKLVGRKRHILVDTEGFLLAVVVHAASIPDRKGTWVLLLRALHKAKRFRVGKDPHPSIAIMDAQSVKTVEESARISGFDGHKRVKGRKRHLLVDTLGIPISYGVTPANMHDTQGARRLLAGLKYFVPRLKTIWADQAYRGQELAQWCQSQGGWNLEVVGRSSSAHSLSKRDERWIVERTFSWLCRNRRMSKDYERKVQTSETLIEVAMIRLLLARLGRRPNDRPNAPLQVDSLQSMATEG